MQRKPSLPGNRRSSICASLTILPLALPLALAMSRLCAEPFQCSQLPPIPDPEGFAAAFSGVTQGALLVAGGANIPGDKWKNPLVKKWYNTVFLLENPKAEWRRLPPLEKPRAYGVSVTDGDGVICAGGSDENAHSAEVFKLIWDGTRLIRKSLPPLPCPCAHATGALLGNTLYLAGGTETPDAKVALKSFWALDLEAGDRGVWRALEPWPGPERMLAVAGAHEGAFFLFSGVKLRQDSAGNTVREYLRDAYQFTPSHGWKKLPDLPRPAVAAPSPALNAGSKLVVLSGDDGQHVNFSPLEQHPGFPKETLAFDADTQTWASAGALPFSRVTVPVVFWADRYVLPNGEVRPRVRTPEVCTLSPIPSR